MDAEQDRFQRQARRQSVWREESAGKSPFQTADPFSSQPSIKPLRRADTGISPLTPQNPEQRLPSIRGSASRRFGSIAPGINGETWSQPFGSTPEEAEESKSPIEFYQPIATAAADAEDPLALLERAAAQGRTSSSYLVRLLNLLLGRSPVKRRGRSGIQVASSIATAHVPAFLKLNVEQGNVYISEYERETDTIPHRVSMPFNRVSSVQGFLDESTTNPALRVIYVNKHEEAMEFLAEAFCIDHLHFEGSERSFRDWYKRSVANRGAFDKAVAWRPSYDLARDTISTIFGVELGHELDAHISRERISMHDAGPKAGNKALSFQRLSVYTQRSLSSPRQGSKVHVFNSGTRGWRSWSRTNTILIYESASGQQSNIIDPVGLQGLELRTSVTTDGINLPQAVVAATEDVLTSVLGSILKAWHKQINKLSVQHAALEDRVYERPSDDSHAGGLWGMSQHALEMAKLVNRHATLCQDVQQYFNQFADRHEEDKWLEDVLKGFRQTSVTVREDFIGPTDYMIDLMYKSISIRDSRQSLELNASLWRLSWITFIFLPLTFLVGLFGMNVSAFNEPPSIKWYWIAAIPMMVVVIGLWFILKHFMPQASRLLRYTEAELDALREKPG